MPAAKGFRPFLRVVRQPFTGVALPDKAPEITLARNPLAILDGLRGCRQICPSPGERNAVFLQKILR